MTNKGAERRAAIVEAAVDLLAEEGWAGVTHRAVAGRAQTNPGLVHYYFEGSAGLRLAVAERAAELSIVSLAEDLLAAEDEAHLLAGAEALLTVGTREAGPARLTTELVSAAFTDPAIGAVLAGAMARTRSLLADWITARRPGHSRDEAVGRAALLLAAVDGAVLHRLLDPDLPLPDLVSALAGLTGTTADPPGGAG